MHLQQPPKRSHVYQRTQVCESCESAAMTLMDGGAGKTDGQMNLIWPLVLVAACISASLLQPRRHSATFINYQLLTIFQFAYIVLSRQAGHWSLSTEEEVVFNVCSCVQFVLALLYMFWI